MAAEEELRRPSALDPLDAGHPFSLGGSPLDLTVADFWRWALGDLRMNTARGYLAEFLVARAVGSTAPIRIEWAAHDVEARDGTRIEVKASGYTQSWAGTGDSLPRYSFKSAYTTRVWDEERGGYVTVRPEERVHVWVFALHTARFGDPYDPLDLGQWEFRVAPHRALIATRQMSSGLAMFERLGIEPVGWEQLAGAVAAARAEHDRLGASSRRG